MDLNSVRFFVQVAHSGSFTVAARVLGVPKSTVSDKVAELEKRLGVGLLIRTTRKLRLTEVGQAYFEKAGLAMNALQAAQEEASQHQELPSGVLRLTTPAEFPAEGILEAIAVYRERYPAVEVQIDFTNREVDLVREGYDLGIRAGHLEDSSLIAKRLGASRYLLIASPAYLRKAHSLRHPRDLAHHDCLGFLTPHGKPEWKLRSTQGKAARFVLRPGVSCSSWRALTGLVARGHGVALAPKAHCAQGLERGEFIQVLREWSGPEVPVSLVYPGQRYLSPKVRNMIPILIDKMSALFG